MTDIAAIAVRKENKMSFTPKIGSEWKFLSIIPADDTVVAIFEDRRVPVKWWMLVRNTEDGYPQFWGVCLWSDGPDICETFADFKQYEFVDNRNFFVDNKV